jgi:YidC/Oxa1 family membrane protein insertase
MESQRLILFFIFSFSLFMLMDAWQRDRNPPQEKPAASEPAAEKKDASVPPMPSEKLAPPAPLSATQGPAPSMPQGATVQVETDVYRAEVSLVGGDLRRLELTQHRGVEDRKANFVLFQQRPDHVYVAQSGLLGPELPTHRTSYTAGAAQYKLEQGANVLEVRLQAPVANGVKVTKLYRFHRSSYVIDVVFEIANEGSATVEPYAYYQFLRDDKPPEGDSAMLPTFTGVGVYTDKDKFQKIAFSDIEKGKAALPKDVKDGWIAVVQHYFLGAWLPKDGTPRELYARRVDNLNATGVIVPAGRIEPASTASVNVPLYAGPQDQDRLAALAPGLDLAVDYGWLTVLAVPLFWLLSLLYDWVGNWGVAIIVLTVIIKLLFYPLSEASYRSMARMRVLAPKMQRLKEQYGDDRQRMQQAMMELYKTEKINPLGGCLPIVVQIPVFIALYWVLLASVELRHAPFMLWIHDLSRPDPWFVLPVLMGATMIFQTRLNPEPPDPVQAKVMKIMPIAFSIFFFFFPAGLVLYWLVNNILSIAQQWHINRVLERANPAAPRKS